MRETSGLGEPPSNITARSFLPVRATIVVTGSRGTGLIGLLSRCVARMGNRIKSLFPLKYHRDRISATRTYAFGTFLHHNLYFTFYFSLFDSFTWYPLHFIRYYLPVTPFILYIFSYTLFFTFYFHFLIVSRGTPSILSAVFPLLPPSFYGFILWKI